MRIAVVAAIVFALVCCSRTPPVGPKIDPALSMLIPADTVLLAGIRLDEIEKTEIYKKYLSQRSIPQIDAFAKQTGVDPRKDLWQLLYVSNGKQSALLGRGKFSDESEPRLSKKGSQRFGYKGFTLVGNEQTAILLLSPTAVAVGDTPELRALIDAKEKSTGPAPAMAELLKDISSDSHIWAAYRGGPIQLPFNATGNLGNVVKAIGTIRSGTLSLDLSMGIKGLGIAAANSEADAGELESGFKALIGLGRLSSPSNQPEQQRIWDGMTATRQERIVKVHITEPPELVDRALNLWIGQIQPLAPAK